ncbi:MAG: hypothetical protein V7K19_20805 [Nostoc sp.]
MKLVPSLKTGNEVTQAFRLFLVPFGTGAYFFTRDCALSVAMPQALRLRLVTSGAEKIC